VSDESPKSQQNVQRFVGNISAINCIRKYFAVFVEHPVDDALIGARYGSYLAETEVVNTTVSLTNVSGVVPVTSSHWAGIVPPETPIILTCTAIRNAHLAHTTRPAQRHLAAI